MQPCDALQHKHLTENDNSPFWWALWAVIGNTNQPLSGASWVSLDSAWAMSMPNLPRSFFRFNCVAHTAQRGKKKHHRKVICERKIKLSLPPYAAKHGSSPAMGWSVLAVGERCALREAWEEQRARHGKSTNGAAAFALAEANKLERQPKFSHSRWLCRRDELLTP